MGILDKAFETASRASKTVVVCLDGAGASERDALYAKLAQASKSNDGRVAKSPTKAITDEIKALEERLQGSLVSIEVVSLTPAKWSQIKRNCPPGKSQVDRMYGFNAEVAVQQALIEKSFAVDGETREPITKSQWETLFSDDEKALSGGDWERLSLAVLTLNQASQSEAIARGKA